MARAAKMALVVLRIVIAKDLIIVDDWIEVFEVKRPPQIAVEPLSSARRTLVVLPPVLSEAKLWFADIVRASGPSNKVYVNYSDSGYDPSSLFPALLDALRSFRDQELVLFGASFGSNVLIEFRRYLRHEAPEMFSRVADVFYSGFGPGSDLRPTARLKCAAGYAMRGGPIMRGVWRYTPLPSMFYPKATDQPTVGSERLAAIKAGIDAFPFRLFASQLREMVFGVRLIRGEFWDDRALILAFDHDDAILPRAADHLSQAFPRSLTKRIAQSGHADIETLQALEAVRIEIRGFLEY